MTLPKMSNLFLFVLICLVTLGPCQGQNSIQNYLDAHNLFRNAVGVPNVTWSTTLQTYANEYVKTLLPTCSLIHSHGPYGENLAWGTGTFTGTDAVKLWTGEKSCYTYSTNSCQSPGPTSCKYGCLHYTQVVWRDSIRIGCARLKCVNGAWLVSCNYDPPGNYVGEKPY